MTAALAVIATAVTPHLGGGGDIGVSYGRVVLALLACLAIAASAILLLRRRAGQPLTLGFPRIAPAARRIAVVETRRIGPHADLCLVEHDAHRWLLVVQPSGVHVLHDAAATTPCD